MKKTVTKKLQLKKETITVLNAENVRHLNGGADTLLVCQATRTIQLTIDIGVSIVESCNNSCGCSAGCPTGQVSCRVTCTGCI